jgi:hypothetical protein
LYYITKCIIPSRPPEDLLENFSDELKESIIQQDNIGWNFILRGILINDWAYIQEQHFMEQKKTNLGDHWSADISKWWIQKSYTVWTCRNEHIHNSSLTEETRTEKETLEQVRKLYELSEQLSSSDKEQFELNLSDRLKQPWRSLQRWVQITTPVVTQCLQAYNSRIRSTHNNIKDYFQTLINQNTENTNTSHPITTEQSIPLHQDSNNILHLTNTTNPTQHSSNKNRQSPLCCGEDQVGR